MKQQVSLTSARLQFLECFFSRMKSWTACWNHSEQNLSLCLFVFLLRLHYGHWPTLLMHNVVYGLNQARVMEQVSLDWFWRYCSLFSFKPLRVYSYNSCAVLAALAIWVEPTIVHFCFRLRKLTEPKAYSMVTTIKDTHIRNKCHFCANDNLIQMTKLHSQIISNKNIRIHFPLESLLHAKERSMQFLVKWQSSVTMYPV